MNEARILKHAESLRRLAYALVRDRDEADDALQETWLRALRSPPRAGSSTGPWLATVLRNVVRTGWRDSTRRKKRELGAPLSPRPGQPAEQLGRIEEATLLLHALSKLSLQKREVIELRFFHGLPPREIASKLDLPVETVKTRIKRAKFELCCSLRSTHGREWPAALALTLDVNSGVHAGTGLATVLPHLGSLLMLKLIVCTAAAVAVLFLGLMFWRAHDHALVAPATSETGTRSGGGPLDANSQRDVIASLKGRGPHSEAKRSDTSAEIGREAPVTPKTIRLTGTVTLSDRDSRETTDHTGSLHFAVDDGSDEVREHSAIVAAGRFSVEIAAAGRLESVRFRRLVVGNRIAVFKPDRYGGEHELARRRDVGLDGNPHYKFEIKGRFAGDTLVRALDATTGRPLPSLYVIPESWNDDIGTMYPHPGTGVGHSEGPFRVPFRLPARVDTDPEQTWYYLGAPGYVWRRVRINHLLREPRVAEFELAGSLALDVGVRGDLGSAWILLERLIAGNFRQWAHCGAVSTRSPIVVEGLAPGDYRALCVTGSHEDPGRGFGAARFSIHAGERTSARLEGQAPATPRTMRFSGAVHIPEGWPIKELEMKVSFAGSPPPRTRQIAPQSLRVGRGLTPINGRPRTYRFDLGLVQEGPYQLSVSLPSATLFRELTIGAGSRSDLEISIPSPTPVRVSVVGEESGAGPLNTILWRGVGQDGTWRASGVAQRAPGAHEFTWLSPPGSMFIRPGKRPRGGSYLAAERRITVRSPGVSATLHVRPPHTIRVRFLEGGREMMQGSSSKVEITPLDNRPTVVETLSRTNLYAVSRPGGYLLKFSRPQGYEPIPDKEIEVNVGEWSLEVIVEVKRRGRGK